PGEATVDLIETRRLDRQSAVRLRMSDHSRVCSWVPTPIRVDRHECAHRCPLLIRTQRVGALTHALEQVVIHAGLEHMLARLRITQSRGGSVVEDLPGSGLGALSPGRRRSEIPQTPADLCIAESTG